MTSTRIIVILMTIFVSAVAPLSASAQDTFTFSPPVGNTGVWGDDANWTGGPPNQFPGAGDTAIIPTGLTCEVANDDQTAQIVRVNNNATLLIKGKTLTLQNDTQNPRLRLNGTLRFETVAQTVPKLLYRDTLLIRVTAANTGLIVADGSAGHSGLIANVNSSDIVEINPEITVQGSVTIECDTGIPGMRLDGTFIVDNASDMMVLGVDEGIGYNVRASSSALFHVSAGEREVK